MAQYEEFQIEQGTDISIELELVTPTGAAKNLTSYTLTAYLKRNYRSTDYTAFTAQISNPKENGICILSLNNEQTDALTPGIYVYDAELSFVDSDGDTVIERILEGRIEVTPSATKVI